MAIPFQNVIISKSNAYARITLQSYFIYILISLCKHSSYSSQIISVKMITLSKRNCINCRNWLLSKLYKIHPDFTSTVRFEFAFKRFNLELASALYCTILEYEAVKIFWVIWDSWTVITNPAKNKIPPATIIIATVDSSFNFLCMQLVLAETENSIKQPQQTCRTTDDKNIPECSKIIFERTFKHRYSWQLSLISEKRTPYRDSANLQTLFLTTSTPYLFPLKKKNNLETLTFSSGTLSGPKSSNAVVKKRSS